MNKKIFCVLHFFALLIIISITLVGIDTQKNYSNNSSQTTEQVISTLNAIKIVSHSLEQKNQKEGLSGKIQEASKVVSHMANRLHRVDPCNICRLEGSHAGDLPIAVCDIIERLRRSKNGGETYHNRYVFFGPPGTGKTTLAKVIANQTGSEFIELNAPAAVDEMQGSGVAKVVKAFERADDALGKNKTVVIFVDEIDAIAREREKTDTHKDLTNTFLTLQTYSDKYKDEPRVVIIMATNKREILDKALTNRFKSVEFKQPDVAQCAKIFLFYLGKYNCKHDFGDKVYEFARLAKEVNLSGRNIESIIQDARWESVKRGLDQIQEIYILEHIEIQKKINEQERKIKQKEEDEKEAQRKLVQLQIEGHEYEMKMRYLHERLLQLQLEAAEHEVKIREQQEKLLWSQCESAEHERSMRKANLELMVLQKELINSQINEIKTEWIRELKRDIKEETRKLIDAATRPN